MSSDELIRCGERECGSPYIRIYSKSGLLSSSLTYVSFSSFRSVVLRREYSI